MGLTQVSTDGVKNDAITKTKIPANQIEASELADNAVDTNAIAADAVTNAKLEADCITHDKINDNAIRTEHITAEAVTLAKLEHGTGSNDGKFLRANNGADPTFETVTGTTINNNADNRVITGSGTANTLEGESDLTYDGTNLSIPNGIIHTGDTNTSIRFPANDNITMDVAGTEVFKAVPDAAHGSTPSTRLLCAHTVDGAAVNMGGTKAYSAGIIRGMANIRDGNAYSVTDNGGGIGFSAVYNSGGSHTTMSQIEGVKANNTDGNYEGAIKFSTRHHNGNMIEKVRIGLNGISFEGQTADAHCLNDYEEGSWTPTCVQGPSTVTSVTARYVKVGNVCTISCSMVPGGNNNTQGVIFGNLPFQTHSSHAGSTSVMHDGFDEDGSPEPTVHIYIGGSTSNFHIYYSRVNGSGWQQAQCNQVHGHQLIFNITYPTA